MKSHPGTHVRDYHLKNSGWTVTEAARRMGVGRPALSRVLNGRAAISPEMAIRFERMGWLVAGIWVSRQARWDLARAYERLSKAEQKELEELDI